MTNQAAERWTTLVRANREQTEALMETQPADFWAPVRGRFVQDPRRDPDPPLAHFLSLLRPDDVLIDVGAGGGRVALPAALRVTKVIAVEPSPAMLEGLRGAAAQHGIENVEVVEGRWPDVEVPAGDVVLFAHVLYDIGGLLPFLEAGRRHARRLCVAMLLNRQPSVLSDDLWPEIYGVERARLPAIEEFLEVLDEAGWPHEVARFPAERFPANPDKGAMLDELRWRLWLKPGGERDQKLRRLIDERAVQRADGWFFPGRRPDEVAVVTWRGAADG